MKPWTAFSMLSSPTSITDTKPWPQE
jgi:hypothetical protein